MLKSQQMKMNREPMGYTAVAPALETIRRSQHARCLIAAGRLRGYGEVVEAYVERPHEFCMINERHGSRLIYQKVSVAAYVAYE